KYTNIGAKVIGFRRGKQAKEGSSRPDTM
nr:hypothetical protein [Tanacetum cinerariifolium]